MYVKCTHVQDFEERCAAVLEITTICSFKHEPFIFSGGGGGGGGGGGLVHVLCGTCICLQSDGRMPSNCTSIYVGGKCPLAEDVGNICA